MLHTQRPLRVLHIEDEDHESRLVINELLQVTSQLQLRKVSEEQDLLDALTVAGWDFVLCNYHSGSLGAREVLRHVKTTDGDLPFILISGSIGEESVAAFMKEGVDDFILKGNYSRLVAVVKRLLMDRDIHRRASKAQKRAFEAFAARERMLAIVSHDIKNPLSAIHLEAQMLMRTVDKYGKSVMGEEVKIQAGRILKTTERMKGLIIDLLEKNKSQEGLKNIQKTLVDPVGLFYESLSNVRPLIQEKKIKVRFAPRENVPELMMDRNKIFQVFSNLLSNAIKFTPPDGEIIFDLHYDDENYYFSLTDSGRGIPPGEEEKVFDKYWTGNKNKSSGTGLGLFICRSIIEAHGGLIKCESVPGNGATFSFRLPRNSSDKMTCGMKGEIYIVDDDEDLCEVMSWSLKNEGLNVRSFRSGTEALAALPEGHPSCIILDFHLGDMNGCEFLKRKKEMGNTAPVILISGSPDEVKNLAPENEFTTIVEKPLDLEGLLREVMVVSATYSQKSSNGASTHSSHGPSSVQ